MSHPSQAAGVGPGGEALDQPHLREPVELGPVLVVDRTGEGLAVGIGHPTDRPEGCVVTEAAASGVALLTDVADARLVSQDVPDRLPRESGPGDDVGQGRGRPLEQVGADQLCLVVQLLLLGQVPDPLKCLGAGAAVRVAQLAHPLAGDAVVLADRTQGVALPAARDDGLVALLIGSRAP